MNTAMIGRSTEESSRGELRGVSVGDGQVDAEERRVLGAEDGVLGLAGGDAREPLLAHFERALADVLGAPGVRGPDGDEDGGLLPRGARDGVDGAEDRCDVDDAGLHGRVFDLRLLRGDGVVVRAWQGKAIIARVAAAGLRPVDELEEVGRAERILRAALRSGRIP